MTTLIKNNLSSKILELENNHEYYYRRFINIHSVLLELYKKYYINSKSNIELIRKYFTEEICRNNIDIITNGFNNAILLKKIIYPNHILNSAIHIHINEFKEILNTMKNILNNNNHSLIVNYMQTELSKLEETKLTIKNIPSPPK